MPQTEPSSPQPGLTVRAATSADIDAVIGFWAAAAENEDRPADRPEALRSLLERDPDALLLALEDERIVGSLIVGWDGWRAHLYRLAVASSHRRRGIARRLLAIAEQRLRAAGAIRIDAMVLDANPSAHTLWSAAGYERQLTWSRWIKPL